MTVTPRHMYVSNYRFEGTYATPEGKQCLATNPHTTQRFYDCFQVDNKALDPCGWGTISPASFALYRCSDLVLRPCKKNCMSFPGCSGVDHVLRSLIPCVTSKATNTDQGALQWLRGLPSSGLLPRPACLNKYHTWRDTRDI